jgi:hypothetical protein
MVKVDPILYALFSTFIQFWRWALYCQIFYGNIHSALTGMASIEDNPIQEQENVGSQAMDTDANPIQEQENVGSQAMDTDAAQSTQVMKCRTIKLCFCLLTPNLICRYMQPLPGHADDASTHPHMKRGQPDSGNDNAMKSRKKKKKNVPKVSEKLDGNKRPPNPYILY